jgi:hypothetical protein
VSGREIESGAALFIPRLDEDKQQQIERAAAVHIGDHIAAEHPTEADDVMPRLAGLALGADPVIAAGVLELLDAIGLLEDRVAAAKNLNARLKGAAS